MKRVFAIILIFVSVAIIGASERIYKKVEPDGTVEFTDQPMQEGKKVTVQPSTTYTQSERPETIKTPNLDKILSPLNSILPEKKALEKKPDKIMGYETVQITAPYNEQTFWNYRQNMPVSVAVDPPLQEGDQIELLVDGKSIGKAKEPVFSVAPLERGQHELVARVINSEGEVLATSKPVTIFIHYSALGGAS